jgi:hypothetical protein
MLQRLASLADPRPHWERGPLFQGLWVMGASLSLLVLTCAPLLVAIAVLPADANPIGLGLLAFAGTGTAAAGLAVGALTALLGLLQQLVGER